MTDRQLDAKANEVAQLVVRGSVSQYSRAYHHFVALVLLAVGGTTGFQINPVNLVQIPLKMPFNGTFFSFVLAFLRRSKDSGTADYYMEEMVRACPNEMRSAILQAIQTAETHEEEKAARELLAQYFEEEALPLDQEEQGRSFAFTPYNKYKPQASHNAA